ncbi:hypothetical protein BaRGS_00031330 [Batillaria attramentaria]|uniref:Serine/threonine-protein phosphatase PGAM5, mitochondrial n=1 Tax=Batillaria attramentaria TaxID=370345 RepID=A0ABD0JQR4_9CAEN
MGWKTFHRLGRLAKSSRVQIITTSATVVVGLVLYERLRNERKVYADANFEQGSGDRIRWDYNWDRREPHSIVRPRKDGVSEEEYQQELKNRTPKATRHLILIRHGQYVDTEKRDENRILTALGREQAEITGERLRSLDLDYTRFITSTMARAMETGEIIYKHLPEIPVEVDDLLREGSPIAPEPPSSNWKPTHHQFYQDGSRIEAAFRKYFHRADVEQKGDSVEIIVCHANVIRYFVCRALQFPPEAWLRLSLAHCSLTQLSIRPSGRVSLRALGDSGHLPPTKITFT